MSKRALYSEFQAAMACSNPFEAYAKLSEAVSDYIGFKGNYLIHRAEPINPRDDDNATVLYLPNRRATYGDARAVDWDEAEGVVWRRPIYFYQHGGNPKFSATPFNDQFDSGVAGVQYICQSGLDLLGITVEQAAAEAAFTKLADDELAEYNAYLEGGDAWVLVRVGEPDDPWHFTADSLAEALEAIGYYTEEFKGDTESAKIARSVFGMAWDARYEAEDYA